MGWSIDQDRTHTLAMLEAMPETKVVSSIITADIAWFTGYYLIKKTKHIPSVVYAKITHKPIIAVATNDLQDNQKTFQSIKHKVSVWLTASQSNQKTLKSAGCKAVTVPFFVDPEIFKPNKELIEIPKKLQDKYILGSFQRDTEGADLVTPKWQKNPQLLVEIAKRLNPKKYAFLLAGPRRHYLIRQLDQLQFPYHYVGEYKYIEQNLDDVRHNTLTSQTISQLYQLTDTYLITSKSEGGPKAVYEAALCHTPIISTKVGVAPEYLHARCITKDDPNSFLKAIKSRQSSTQAIIDHNYQKVIEHMNQKHIMKQYRQALSLL